MSTAEPLDADLSDVPWEHDRTTVDDVSLHYVVAGPPDGDLVVLLHGFPECWYAWHRQIPALADAGFRVVAPDMRGANRSEKPSGVGAYALPRLAEDVAGIVSAFDRERARVVGHDFGGLVTWHLAHERPDLLEHVSVLNCPHLSVYGRHLSSSLSQMRKSWYVFYFQLPRVPEWSFAWDDYAVIDSLYEDNVAPEAMTEADVARMKRSFARDGATRASIHWYRALFRWYGRKVLGNRGVPSMPIQVPTLLLWGEEDHALDAAMIDDHREWVDDIRIERYPDAGHWVQFEAAEDVTDRLLSAL